MADWSVDAAIFWASVEKTESCWLWGGYRTSQGYGVVRKWANGRWLRAKMAHRVAWQLTNGPIPDGLFACHHCDNPPCCNPSHLFLGTAADNARDMIIKGRKHGWERGRPNPKLRGRAPGTAKLKPSDVAIIRATPRSGSASRELALRFGVKKRAIYAIWSRETYRFLP